MTFEDLVGNFFIKTHRANNTKKVKSILDKAFAVYNCNLVFFIEFFYTRFEPMFLNQYPFIPYEERHKLMLCTFSTNVGIQASSIACLT
jgi:hypothetical protein